MARAPSNATPELPAEATIVTPTFTARQTAAYSGSVVVAHEVGIGPALPTLMFAILMLSAWALAATQSMPQMRLETVPAPVDPRTLTAYSLAPGATPTTPLPPLPAAIVPATWVPWPWSSWALAAGLMQFVPSTASRSGLLRSMPVSMTAIAPPGVSWLVSAEAASMRLMPDGTVSPAASGAVSNAWIARSAVTDTTCGSSFSAST